MRNDLLLLTEDDLVTLANRGLVKRARAEVEGGQLTCELAEDEAGNVTAKWSDDVECRLPAGTNLANGRCSCPATSLCRHLLRSVLAYQQQQSAGGTAAPAAGASAEPRTPAEAAPQAVEASAVASADATAEAPETATPTVSAIPTPPASEPWNPGDIPDEELARHFANLALTRARRQFDDGHVVELVRSAKPTARIHTLSCTVRFLVPGNPAYTHCDCAEPAPCSHVPLAIWAFRMLEAEKTGGLLSTHKEALPIPEALLEELEQMLLALADSGIAGAEQPLIDRIRRLEHRCRDTGLVWPAEILAELIQQQECYRGHDARFSPVRVAELVGELCIRMDAIRSDTGAVPQLFIRGSANDRVTEVQATRLIGLGCGARFFRGGVTLSAYAQDVKSGAVVAIMRDFTDPPEAAPEAPRELWQLGRTQPIKNSSFQALGSGQLHPNGGKRTPSYQFILGRSAAALQPQAFDWEAKLRAPVLSESFGELAARLAALPPASLRPRRLTEDLYACPIRRIEGVEFSEPDQEIRAVLLDAEDRAALLIHPYTHRGREGAEALLQALSQRGEAVRFVAGHFRQRGPGLIVSPVALILEGGKTRTMLQPWVDRHESAASSTAANAEAEAETEAEAEAETEAPTAAEPWRHYLRHLLDALGELLLVGLRRADGHAARTWSDLHRHGGGLGFVRFIEPVEQLAGALAEKERTLRWETGAAASALFETAVLTHLALQELAL